MSCDRDSHELLAVNADVLGTPPQSNEEPAWCRICGALWRKNPFGMGWGFQHPLNDHDAPTLMNILRKEQEKEEAKNADEPNQT